MREERSEPFLQAVRFQAGPGTLRENETARAHALPPTRTEPQPGGLRLGDSPYPGEGSSERDATWGTVSLCYSQRTADFL